MARPKAYKGHNPLYGHACAAFSIHSVTLGFGGRPWCLSTAEKGEECSEGVGDGSTQGI